MAIIVHHEPAGLGQPEPCTFCKKGTRYWDASAKFVICQECAAAHTPEELKERKRS